jgi:hypothetical protein
MSLKKLNLQESIKNRGIITGVTARSSRDYLILSLGRIFTLVFGIYLCD